MQCAGLRVLGEVGLEPFHLSSERERARAEHSGKCRFQVTLKRSVLSVEGDEANFAPTHRRDCCCLHIPPLLVSVQHELCHPGAADEIGRRAHASFSEMNSNNEV